MAAKLVARTLQVSGGICLLASLAASYPPSLSRPFIATYLVGQLSDRTDHNVSGTIRSALVAAGGIISLAMSRDVVRFRPIIKVYALCIAVIPLWVMIITARDGLPWWFLVGDIVCSS